MRAALYRSRPGRSIAAVRGAWAHVRAYFVVDTIYFVVDNKSMPRMGRPKIKASQRKRHQIAIRLTDAEYTELKRAAGKSEISNYIRHKLGLRGDK